MAALTAEHGTWRRYRYDGCGCGRCVHAWSTYVQVRKLDRRRGRQRLVDAGPVLDHVWMLGRLWGVTPNRVFQAAGTSWAMGHRLLSGQSRLLDRGRVRAILRVDIDDIDDGAWMDSRPMMEAADRLRKLGWSDGQIEQAAGLSRNYLPDHRRKGRTKCRVGVWRRVNGLVGTCIECGVSSVGGGRWCLGCLPVQVRKAVG